MRKLQGRFQAGSAVAGVSLPSCLLQSACEASTPPCHTLIDLWAAALTSFLLVDI